MEISARDVDWIILYSLYTSVTQQEEFRSDTSAVVGSTPTTSTMLPWAADPLMTTGGDRLVNRLW